MKLSPARLEHLVRLLHGGVALLRLFADAQQTDRGILAAEDVFGIDGAKPRELHQLVGGAIDVRARVEHDDRLARRRKDRGDRRALEARVQAEHDHRRGHLRAGVAGGDERVGVAVGLELEPERSWSCCGLPRMAAPGLSVISMTSGASTIAIRSRCDAQRRIVRLVEQRVERARDDVGSSDELNGMSRIKLAEGEQRAGNGRLGSEVAPHGVQRDPRQGYASLAATRCLPP